MKKIIVATDFSDSGNNACSYAAEMAVKIRADLILLHVIQLPALAGDLPVTFDVEYEKKDALQTLGLLRQKLCGKALDKITISTSVYVGTFFYELTKLCEKVTPFLVILGSQGTTASENAFLGQHAVYTLKHLPWPVLAVPESARFAEIKSVGLACDMQNVTKTIPAEQIQELIRTLGARLHIINVSPTSSFSQETVVQAEILRKLFEEFNPSYDLLTGKNDDEIIIEFSEKNNIDLLILLPKRHGLIDQLLHHSHTRRLVLYSGVPVLTLHTQQNKSNSAVA